ncbi:MAG: hypothetical protein ACFFAS_16085 [Promethearchaeota archaeon]
MPMTLGDGFSRRKQVASELATWINRLHLAGRNSIKYQTKKIEGDEKFKPIPGSIKDFKRSYTIEECNTRIKSLIEEDRKLARRISLTNQEAKSTMIDLEGNEVVLTIPELLVLKNDIAPKLENAKRSIPIKAKGVDVMETTDNYLKWRTINPVYKKKQSLSEQGHKIEEEYIDYYNVEEIVDYGFEEREVYDEIDKLQAWMQRLKEAINQANKTELISLD